MKITGKSYIGYSTSENKEKTFKTFSCSIQKENDEVYYQISKEELEDICLKAKQTSPKFALSNLQQRIDFLKDIILGLEKNRNQLVKQFCKESSLLEDRANIELTRTQVQIQTYLDYISQKDWNLVSKETKDGITFEKRLFPIGPVVVFGASNFPFAYSTIGGDTASALAAGNPVIYKANPLHAGVSELTTQIILDAAQKNHLPDGVFSLVQGTDYWIGEDLVKNENVAAVGFTGSVRGGVALLDYAKQRKVPIPVFCEMGSLNPTFIFKDAFDNKMDEMVQKLFKAITNDAGQFCTKPGLIFVEGERGEAFVEKLTSYFENVPAIPMLHSSIYHAFEKLRLPFEKFNTISNSQKAPEYYAKPELVVISAGEFIQSKEAKEEVFGPFSIIVKCENEKEMKEALLELEGNLTASLWTNKNIPEDWIYLLSQKVGRIIKNGVSTGVAVIDSMHHGGNFPATSDSRFTAVGKDAIYRFLQPVTFQNFE